MIDYNKYKVEHRIKPSTFRAAHKEGLYLKKKKLTKNNKEFLKLIGLLK